MNNLFPPLEPYAVNRLAVSDLHTITYEEAGNRSGKPALFLHGGPGVGILPEYRRFFDPEEWQVVLPDQRGAGRSTPHAELTDNNTWALVEDLEKLRAHLKIDRWVVVGGSWGSTLTLCYAIKHPERVRGMVIRGVFLATQAETDWLFKFGLSEIYPDEWERFRALIPPAERADLVAAYHRRLLSDDEAVRLQAAAAWSRLESATMNLVTDEAVLADFTEPHKALAIGRIECHYTFNRFFMPADNWILENVNRLQGIPLFIVQGRHDVICPVRAAWELHRALPQSQLRIVPDGAHSPLDAGMAGELVAAIEELKNL